MNEERLQVESQEQLANDYLVAYAQYKEIADKRTSDLKVLDGLRDDAQSADAIAEQKALYDSTRGEEERALERCNAIRAKLTPETIDKFLKVSE